MQIYTGTLLKHGTRGFCCEITFSEIILNPLGILLNTPPPGDAEIGLLFL